MAYDANWWVGPNSLFGTILQQSKYGHGANTTDSNADSLGEWFQSLFKGTGVTATVGVAPDTDVVNQIKQYLPLLVIGYFLFKK